jgi:hypothetical protein
MSALYFLPFCMFVWQYGKSVSCATLAWLTGIHPFTAVFYSTAWLVGRVLDFFFFQGRKEGGKRKILRRKESLSYLPSGHLFSFSDISTPLKAWGIHFCPYLDYAIASCVSWSLTDCLTLDGSFNYLSFPYSLGHCCLLGLSFFPFVKWRKRLTDFWWLR